MAAAMDLAAKLDPASEPEGRRGIERLTDKQREVLDHLILYKSDKEIARDLGISLKTVEQRMAGARQKLGTTDRNETARLYAALREDRGFPLYRPSPLPPAADPANQAAEIAPEAAFTLHDAGFAMTPPWEMAPRPRVLPEVFHGRSATAVRLAVIGACTIALLMMALLAIAIGEGLTDLFG